MCGAVVLLTGAIDGRVVAPEAEVQRLSVAVSGSRVRGAVEVGASAVGGSAGAAKARGSGSG